MSGREQLIGAQGTALESFEREGEVFVHSERWSAVSETPVAKGEDVVVTRIDGLVLSIRPTGQRKREQEDV